MSIEPLTLDSAMAEAEAYLHEMKLRPRRPVEFDEEPLLAAALALEITDQEINEPAD